MLHGAPQEICQHWEAGTPFKRLGTAEEVAEAFIYFASDESRYCNGTHLAVDGRYGLGYIAVQSSGLKIS